MEGFSNGSCLLNALVDVTGQLWASFVIIFDVLVVDEYGHAFLVTDFVQYGIDHKRFLHSSISSIEDVTGLKF